MLASTRREKSKKPLMRIFLSLDNWGPHKCSARARQPRFSGIGNMIPVRIAGPTALCPPRNGMAERSRQVARPPAPAAGHAAMSRPRLASACRESGAREYAATTPWRGAPSSPGRTAFDGLQAGALEAPVEAVVGAARARSCRRPATPTDRSIFSLRGAGSGRLVHWPRSTARTPTATRPPGFAIRTSSASIRSASTSSIAVQEYTISKALSGKGSGLRGTLLRSGGDRRAPPVPPAHGPPAAESR